MSRQATVVGLPRSTSGEPAVPPAPSALELARRVITDPVVWLLVGAGLALRLAVGWMLSGHALVSDEAEYLAAARILAEGRGFGFYDAAPWLRPPAYPVFLASLSRIFGPGLGATFVVQVVASLTVGVLTAWIAWLAGGGRAVARLAAGLTLLALPLVVLPWLLLTETMFTLLLLLALGGLLARIRGGGWGWLIAAGGALGVACLLRGMGLGYAAVIVAVAACMGPAKALCRLRDAVLVAVVVVAVIAPWTARNLVAYRAFIPLETTGAYNFWLRAQGGRGESWMLSELREQPDIAARQAHAWQRGTALVLQDPGAYLARGWRELGDVARLNFGADERFTAGSAHGEVSRTWLVLSLMLDDLLVLLLLPLAALGLARRVGPLRWVTLGWLGWTAILALAFFAIARFRTPLLPLLAIQAAIAVVEWRTVVSALRARQAGMWLAASTGLIALVVAAPSFDPRAYQAAWQARTGWEIAEAAEERRQAGDVTGAMTLLDAGPAQGTHVALARALALSQAGRSEAAAEALVAIRADPRALVALGELERQAGDRASAQRYWSTREVDVANPLAWAWERLNAPSASVSIGNGLDIGLVRGMHGPERDGDLRYRWTNGRGEVRLMPSASGQHVLTATLRSVRPNGTPVLLTVSIDGRRVGTWSVGDAWNEHVLPIELNGAPVTVELASDVFVPGYTDPRSLGVMVDWIALRPTSAAGVLTNDDDMGARAR